MTSIRNSHRIFVLTDHGIEEEGAQEELLSAKAFFIVFILWQSATRSGIISYKSENMGGTVWLI